MSALLSRARQSAATEPEPYLPEPLVHRTPIVVHSMRWVDRFPANIRPYIDLTRFDNPIGPLFYPFSWSITMASYAHKIQFTILLTHLGLFYFSAIVMRGAGCTINDIWDMGLDKAVERTRNRPLARGDITRRQALVFFVGQVVVGLSVLLRLNMYSILLGTSSVSLIIIYPLMKRITYWPQTVLGLTINWGALLGWSAVVGTVNWRICMPLYAGGICWTLVYDSIYAHQDKTDDVKVGIRSTALLFGEHTRPILSVFTVLVVTLIMSAGALNGQGAPFYIGVCLGAAQLSQIVLSTDFESPESSWNGFIGCGWFGFWVWMGASVDYAFMETELLNI